MLKWLRATLATATMFATWTMTAQDFRGSLLGIVRDATGARVPSATIQLRATESLVERRGVSDSLGQFRFDNLLPGPYFVTVDADGLAEARSKVKIVVSFVREIAVTMSPASLQQTVSVPALASFITTPPMDSTSAVHGGAVTAQDRETILLPGTEPVEPSDPNHGGFVGGSSGLNNVHSVDGGDNSDDYIGGFLQNFSPDAIQEFAVRTSQEEADTCRTVGGSVVITTKRGTNDWHSSTAFYERAAALNARRAGKPKMEIPIKQPTSLCRPPGLSPNHLVDSIHKSFLETHGRNRSLYQQNAASRFAVIREGV